MIFAPSRYELWPTENRTTTTTAPIGSLHFFFVKFYHIPDIPFQISRFLLLFYFSFLFANFFNFARAQLKMSGVAQPHPDLNMANILTRNNMDDFYGALGADPNSTREQIVAEFKARVRVRLPQNNHLFSVYY